MPNRPAPSARSAGPLSGAYMQLLHDALLDAFRSHDKLERMLRFGMDVKLNAIVGEGPLSTVVFELINWAESEGRIDELLRAAHKENPGNPNLDAFLKSWPSSESPLVYAHSATPNAMMAQKQAPATVTKLSDDLLHKVHDAAIRLGLANSRNTLLGGMAPSISAQLPTVPSPLEQLLRDLQVLNEIGRLRDGSVPLTQWLDAALRLTSIRPESEVFATARRVLSD